MLYLRPCGNLMSNASGRAELREAPCQFRQIRHISQLPARVPSGLQLGTTSDWLAHRENQTNLAGNACLERHGRTVLCSQ